MLHKPNDRSAGTIQLRTMQKRTSAWLSTAKGRRRKKNKRGKKGEAEERKKRKEGTKYMR